MAFSPTALSTSITPSSSGVATDANTVHAAVNALTAGAVAKDDLVLRAQDHGVGTSGDQTTALQAFLTSVPAGSKVRLDQSCSFSSVTVAGNDLDIEIPQGVTLTKTGATTDGVLITGARVTLRGAGTITSPATFDGTNVQPTYAVVRVTGDSCKVRDVKLVNVPKVGIYYDDTAEIDVFGVTVQGNFPAGSFTGTQTGHFGIAYNPGTTGAEGRGKISGNRISGCVQGIFVGNYGTAPDAYGLTITGNTVSGCHNHGIYNAGGVDACTVVGNSLARCQTAVAVTGLGHVISSNTIFTSQTGTNADVAGISLRESTGGTVSNNTIKGDAPSASVIIDLTNLTGTTTSRNTVSGNTVDVTGGSAVAIRVGRSLQTSICHDNVVTGNTVRGNGNVGVGLISLNPQAKAASYGNKITGNTVVVTGESYGINASNTQHATVQNNSIRFEFDAGSAKTLGAVVLVGAIKCIVSNNDIHCPAAWGTNVALRGVWEQALSLGTMTVSDTTDTLTVSAAHGLVVGDAVQLGTMTAGAPLTAGVVYYVQSVPSSTTLTLAATFGGALIDVTTAGSSTSIALAVGNRIISNGFHGDLTKLTSFTPITLVTFSDSYLDERGPGSPSGAFYGGIGSRWSRSDGGAATSIYIKEAANTSATWVAK